MILAIVASPRKPPQVRAAALRHSNTLAKRGRRGGPDWGKIGAAGLRFRPDRVTEHSGATRLLRFAGGGDVREPVLFSTVTGD
jgi:hypothetical protein